MEFAAGDENRWPGEGDATRALPVLGRRELGSIRFAHSGAGPADDLFSRSSPRTDLGGRADGSARADRSERVRLADRVRRAGSIRLTERLLLMGRGGPPEIAHE
jgi:hypothetical protein